MKSIKFMLIIALFLALSMTALAQNTDQGENECFEGGALYGQCNTTDVDNDGDIDQYDIDWMYTCGFYLTYVDDLVIIGNDEIPLEGCYWAERIIPRPEEVKEKVRRVRPA